MMYAGATIKLLASADILLFKNISHAQYIQRSGNSGNRFRQAIKHRYVVLRWRRGESGFLVFRHRMGTYSGPTVLRSCHFYPFEGDLERTLKLDQYVKCLEDERKKIEAFKRELPLCMQLLNEEIEASKDLLSDHNQASHNQRAHMNSAPQKQDADMRTRNTQPLLGMFLPSKKPIMDTSPQVNDSKENDRTKTTISNGAFRTEVPNKEELYPQTKETSENVYTDPDMEGMKPVIGNGRAFLPFTTLRKSMLSSMSGEHGAGEEYLSPHVGRLSSVVSNFNKECQSASTSGLAAGISNSCPVRAPQRKPRRCWSPDLHRRFVDALQQLGGSEVATPKQIRELMNIDGLTNDEVKSHLQKYRLHTRRPNQGFHHMPSHTSQLVLIGGIWVPEYAEHAGASGDHAASQQNSGDQRNYHMPLRSLSKEHCVGHNSIDKGQVHPAITCSQGSSQEPPSQSSDASKEEIVEDGNEGFSWKAEHQEGNCETYDAGNLHGS